MKQKRLFAVILVLLLALSMAACGGSGGGSENSGEGNGESAEKVVIHVGSTVSTTHAWYHAALEMKDEIYEKSDGSIELVLDFGGIHGGDREITEAVQNGTLGMAWAADIGYATVVPEIGYVNLPYLFPTQEDVDKTYFNGWIGDSVKASMLESGMEVLGFTDNDFRYMTNSKKPLSAPADLKNLKIRVPQNPMYLKFFELIGCQPTAMNITEVASALQQKTIDGQDNGPTLTYTFGFYQFQPYITRTNHAYAGAACFASSKLMESLSDEQQTLVREMGAKYAAVSLKYMREDVAKFEDEMEKSGCEILDPSPELEALFRDAANKVWHDDKVTATFDQEAMAKILESN